MQKTITTENLNSKTSLSQKTILLLIILPVALFLFSLIIGRYYVSLLDCLKILLSTVFPIDQTWSNMDAIVVLQVRLPRAILAMCVGAALSISGASFQGIFRNPLVSPDILGVSSAAGFGAALAILISGNPGLIYVTLSEMNPLPGIVVRSRVWRSSGLHQEHEAGDCIF